MKRLVLASTSPYRRQLLERLGVDFRAEPPNVDETAAPNEAPAALAMRLAEAKAHSVAEPHCIVIGCDQVPSVGNEILRKPGHHAAALDQLIRCQGQTVEFHTATFVLDIDSGANWQHGDCTRVTFAERNREELDRYLSIEQPYDCAGGFKVEGLGIALFTSVETKDPTALIGLPLIWVASVLKDAGLDPLGETR